MSYCWIISNIKINIPVRRKWRKEQDNNQTADWVKWRVLPAGTAAPNCTHSGGRAGCHPTRTPHEIPTASAILYCTTERGRTDGRAGGRRWIIQLTGGGVGNTLLPRNLRWNAAGGARCGGDAARSVATSRRERSLRARNYVTSSADAYTATRGLAVTSARRLNVQWHNALSYY